MLFSLKTFNTYAKMTITEQNQPTVAQSGSKISKPRKPPKKKLLKSAIPPVFILPSSLPPTSDEDKIFGLEIKRAVEKVLGMSEYEDSDTVECVQRCNGIYKIFLSEEKDRSRLLINGMSVRGHFITTYGENPLAINGQDAVRLKIKNIDYETPDEDVVNVLKSIGFTLASNIMYECFRNEDGKLLKTKNGFRFVFVLRPTRMFSEKNRDWQ